MVVTDEMALFKFRTNGTQMSGLFLSRRVRSILVDNRKCNTSAL